jgi:hypothetical protein
LVSCLRIVGLFIAILLLLPAVAGAQELWRGTRYAMTVEEVLAQVPEASRAVEPDSLGSGDKGILEIPVVEIANEPFEATFFFRDNRLTQVTLGLKDKKPFSMASLDFESVLDALRVKYGKEQSVAVKGFVDS